MEVDCAHSLCLITRAIPTRDSFYAKEGVWSGQVSSERPAEDSATYTYVVSPLDAICQRMRIDKTVEVQIHALVNRVGVQGLSQSDTGLWNIWKGGSV